MTAHQADLDELELRTTKVIRPLSWLIPWGIYPLHSEALQRTRPFVTWAVVALTVVVSLAFLGMEFVGSPAMRTLKNLMLWDNDAVVDADHVAVFAMMTSYGDSEALSEALNEMPEDMPDDEQIMKAYKSLTPEQRPIGEFQLIQLKLAKMEVARLNIQNLVFRQIEMASQGASPSFAEASAM